MRKKSFYILFLLGNLFFIASTSLGQIDSTKIIEKEAVKTNYPDTFNYIQHAYVDKSSQFEIALYHSVFEVFYYDWDGNSDDPDIGSPLGLGLKLSYEKKVLNYFSIKPSLIFVKGSDGYKNYVLNMDFRYYFDLRKRMEKVQIGNSFAATYIGVRQVNMIREGEYKVDKTEWNFDKGIWEIYKTKEVNYHPLLIFYFGKQYEISKRFILDFNFGALFNIENMKGYTAIHGEVSFGYSF